MYRQQRIGNNQQQPGTIEPHCESNSESNSSKQQQSEQQPGTIEPTATGNYRTSRNREQSKRKARATAKGTGKARATAATGNDQTNRNQEQSNQPQPGRIKADSKSKSKSKSNPTSSLTKQFLYYSFGNSILVGHEKSKRSKQRMSSNFLRIAAPVSTSHETYTNLSEIKPMKKERNRRSTYKDGVSKYMETSWGGKIGGKKKYQPEQALLIENFDMLDSTKDEHIVAFDDTNPLLRIFAKVSRKVAKQHMALKKNIKVLRKFAPEIVGAKPTVPRGHKRGSINNDYVRELFLYPLRALARYFKIIDPILNFLSF
eukprot:jgi/Psemu1/25090/gm1.25090_g